MDFETKTRVTEKQVEEEKQYFLKAYYDKKHRERLMLSKTSKVSLKTNTKEKENYVI